jgi:transcriptional regulator with XRE-family HTH domain
VALLLEVSKVVDMITSRQIRAARALLDWSQQQLADKAGIEFLDADQKGEGVRLKSPKF